MAVHSNILIFAASVLVAGDLLVPKPCHAGSSVVVPVYQVGSLGTTRTTVASSRALLSQKEPGPRLEQSKTSSTVAVQATASNPGPPFLRRPILFDPNSLEPSLAGMNMLRRAAAWLGEHREARVLIVGSCDSSGSETCTHSLAEARGAAIRKFLQSSGITSDQVVGVKGWDNLDQGCRPADIKCQQFNRSARIFVASSVAPGEKP